MLHILFLHNLMYLYYFVKVNYIKYFNAQNKLINLLKILIISLQSSTTVKNFERFQKSIRFVS